MECADSQLVSISKILSEEKVKELQLHDSARTQEIVSEICDKNGAFFQMLLSTNISRAKLHSSWFKNNIGHFVGIRNLYNWQIPNVMKCTDEPMNATDDPSFPCNTDIYSTKKIEKDTNGYLSFFKSLMRSNRDGNIKEREGLILVLLDGMCESDLVEFLLDAKKRSDTGVKDVDIVTIESLIVRCVHKSVWILQGIVKYLIFLRCLIENQN